MHFSAIALVLVAFIYYNVDAGVLINITTDSGNETETHEELQGIKDELRDLSDENYILHKELELLKMNFTSELNKQKQEILKLKAQHDPELSHFTTTTSNIVSAKPPIAALPTSCAEAMQSNADYIHSGVYLLNLPDLPPFEVFCLKDTNNGSAWTIVQRRQDGSIDFYRDWIDYQIGFGNLYGEFWLGLDKLHALTEVAKQELWIYLEDFDGEIREARYDIFAIGNEKTKYNMHTLGNYKGDSGDSLRYHFNNKFSTRDSDNDADPIGSCARAYKGAWWFKACSNSDLNGKYLLKNDPEVAKGNGVEWHTWRGHYSLKRVHMGIRPISK